VLGLFWINRILAVGGPLPVFPREGHRQADPARPKSAKSSRKMVLFATLNRWPLCLFPCGGNVLSGAGRQYLEYLR
jgi:hypothetical protein